MTSNIKNDKRVLVRFALPAILAALAGAWLLSLLSGIPAVASYTIGGGS